MENLGIDYKLLIAQVINFLIFFFVFKKYIAKPFTAFITAEKTKEQEKERILKELSERDEKMKKEENDWKVKVRTEREEIVNEAKKAATTVKQDLITQAQTEAQEIVSGAKKAMEDERNAMYKEIQTKTVDLSVSIIQNALQDYLTEDARKTLTDHVIKKASSRVS
jgi:F-type H+-transporting ATPase subunit b